jgi:septal ring factor EnvC (AmiA/AmiB activator)
MSEETLASAIARIDRAVARIDQAVRQRNAGSNALAKSLASLEERHAALRTRIHETIDRLDGLIDAEGQD